MDIDSLSKRQCIDILRRVTGEVGDTARTTQAEYQLLVGLLNPDDVAEAIAVLNGTAVAPVAPSAVKGQELQRLRTDNRRLHEQNERLLIQNSVLQEELQACSARLKAILAERNPVVPLPGRKPLDLTPAPPSTPQLSLL